MKNKKGDVTSTSSTNQNDFFSRNQPICVNEISKRDSENQRFCPCGEMIPRDEVIFENAKKCKVCRDQATAIMAVAESIINTPRTIVKCEPCKSCRKPYALRKLSKLLVCKDCLAKAQTESPSKRNRIIAGIVENYAAALRRQISAGGQTI